METTDFLGFPASNIQISHDLATTWKSSIFPHTSTDTIIDSDRYNPMESLMTSSRASEEKAAWIRQNRFIDA